MYGRHPIQKIYPRDDTLLSDLTICADENDAIGATERLRNSCLFPNNCNSFRKLLVDSTKLANRTVVMSGSMTCDHDPGMTFESRKHGIAPGEWFLKSFEVPAIHSFRNFASGVSHPLWPGHPPEWVFAQESGTYPSKECTQITVSNSVPPEVTEIEGSLHSRSYLRIVGTPYYQAIYCDDDCDDECYPAVGFVRYKPKSHTGCIKKSYLVQPCAWTKEVTRVDTLYMDNDYDLLNWVVTRRKGLDVQIRTLSMSMYDVDEPFNIYWEDVMKGQPLELEKLYKTVITKPADRKQVLRMPLLNALRRSLLLENIVKPWFMALREKVEMQRARDPVKKLVAAALEVVKSQLVLGLEPAAPVVGVKRKYE